MCMHVTVQPEKCEPIANVLTLPSGEAFVSLKLGDATVILPGHDIEAIDYIGDLVEVLRLASKAIVLRTRAAAEAVTA